MEGRHGTICRDGVKSFAQTFDTIGFFARSISDIQLISRACKVIDEAYDSGTTTGTSPKAIKDCRFAFLKTDQFESHATDDLKAVWAKARQLLLAAGASVVDLDLPPDFHGFSAEDGLMPKLTAAEGRTNLLYEYLIGKDDLDPELAGFVDDKPVVATRQEVARIEDTLASLRPEIDSIAARYDAIVTPSVPGEAPKGLGWTGDPRFCTPWTGLHVPSINVPGFASSHGLPIGLTLVAPRYLSYTPWRGRSRVCADWFPGTTTSDCSTSPSLLPRCLSGQTRASWARSQRLKQLYMFDHESGCWR